MAHPDDPQRALSDASGVAHDTPSAPTSTAVPLAASSLVGAAAAALLFCALAYLAYAVPGRWFPSVPERAYGASQLTMSRGTAVMVANELQVSRAADDGSAVISANTDFRASDYPVVAWIAAGLKPDAHVALLWRTDVEPSSVNKRAIDVSAGQAMPVDVHDDPHWIGRVVGLALVVQGPIDAPIRIRGAIAKPAGMLDTIRDRAREWMAPEPWTGSSINTIAGGADVQLLPLPLLLAATVAVTGIALSVVRRLRGRAAGTAVAGGVLAVALCAWFALDARWTLNLVRQARATALQFAGKDNRQQHLAGDDRDLYAFIEQARAKMPATPSRAFVIADADYFRGRAAYYLYPHNVWYEPYRNAVPPANRLRAGDFIVVYQRRGVAYDAGRHSLKWDGGATVSAELKLVDHGGALFVVQ